MKKNLPIIYLDVNAEDDGSGMEGISFVSIPATQIAWNKFADQELVKATFTKDEMQRIVTGPVMLAETPIYRNSPDIGEYYVKFSAESIKTMMIKYFKQMKIHNSNENHNSKKPIKNAILFESFFVGDRAESLLYPQLPDGSCIASFYIEDEKFWNERIMSDEFTGFSLEGYFIETYENDLIEDVYSKVEQILSSAMAEDKKLELLDIQFKKINLTK